MPIETMTDHTIWLTIAVFLPLVGVLALFFINRRDEQTIKAVGIITALATFAVSLYVLSRFDFDNAQKLQFFADHQWIEFIRANYTIGLGDQPAAVRAVQFHHARRDDLHVGQHAGGGQPESVHRPHPRPPGRHGRDLRRPGPDPLLRLLRDRPPADVLHDRRLGRREPHVRLAEVLPLHDVRVGADARRLPGAVLPDRRAELLV